MNLLVLTTLALRLGAIYAFAQALAVLPLGAFMVLGAIRVGEPFSWVSSGFAWLGLTQLLMGCLLWLTSKPLATALVPAGAGQGDRASLDPTALHAVALALIGLWVALHGASSLLRLLGQILNPQPSFLRMAPTYRLSALPVPVFEVVTGMALTLCAKPLSRWWAKL